MRKVYHGGTQIIDAPVCHVGRDRLDFGKGFYVTDMRKQAISWATRVVNEDFPQWLNVYKLDDAYIKEHARCKVFTDYDEEWIDFIVRSRSGKMPWKDYDYIEGGIADDRVVSTIEDYLNGDASMEYVLKRLSEHQPNNQICFISQEILNNSLQFIKAEPLNDLARKEAEKC